MLVIWRLDNVSKHRNVRDQCWLLMAEDQERYSGGVQDDSRALPCIRRWELRNSSRCNVIARIGMNWYVLDWLLSLNLHTKAISDMCQGKLSPSPKYAIA